MFIPQQYLMNIPIPDSNLAIITSLFGPRNLGYGSTNHAGIDFGVPVGTPIVAPLGGRVTEEGRFSGNNYPTCGSGSAGNYCAVTSNDGSKLKFRIMHLSRLDVKSGDQVDKGQLLGLSGNTGCSSGPHGHGEVSILCEDGSYDRVDPLYFLKGQIKITDSVKKKLGVPTNVINLPFPIPDDGILKTINGKTVDVRKLFGSASISSSSASSASDGAGGKSFFKLIFPFLFLGGVLWYKNKKRK